MSEQQLKAFLEKLKGDAAMQEKLKSTDDINAVVEIAKAAGFMISAEELKKTQAEVSEKELEGVAGGTGLIPLFITCAANCIPIATWKKSTEC